jgi:hypothetical protein
MATNQGLNSCLEPLDITDAASLDSWHERFILYTVTNSTITDANKTAYYLTIAGKAAYELLKDLAFPEDITKKAVDDLHKLLQAHVKPANFEATERAKFHNLCRASDERPRSFLLRIQQQAAKCNFGAQLEEQMRDRIIAGINYPEVQRKLLSKKKLTYAQAKQELSNYDDVKCALAPTVEAMYAKNSIMGGNKQSSSSWQSRI